MIRETNYVWSNEKKVWEKETQSLMYIAQNILGSAKNVLYECAFGGSQQMIGSNEDYYVISRSSYYSVTARALINLSEIENYDISGNMKVYLYTTSGYTFDVVLDNFTINGQNVYWDSNTQRFYK